MSTSTAGKTRSPLPRPPAKHALLLTPTKGDASREEQEKTRQTDDRRNARTEAKPRRRKNKTKATLAGAASGGDDVIRDVATYATYSTHPAENAGSSSTVDIGHATGT